MNLKEIEEFVSSLPESIQKMLIGEFALRNKYKKTVLETIVSIIKCSELDGVEIQQGIEDMQYFQVGDIHGDLCSYDKNLMCFQNRINEDSEKSHINIELKEYEK